MEGAIIASCCFDSKIIAFPIYSHTTYKDVNINICYRFKSFDGDEVELSYTFECYSACLMQTDIDIQMMYLSLSNENKSSVDVTVNFSVVSPRKKSGNNSLISQSFEARAGLRQKVLYAFWRIVTEGYICHFR